MTPRSHGPRRSVFAVRRALAPALLGLAAVLVVGILATPSMLPTPGPSLSRLVPSETIPPWNTWTCNPPNLSPTALSIPRPNPNLTLALGDVVTAAYEYRVVNYTKADHGVHVYLPTVKVVFPMQASGPLVLNIAPKTVTLTGTYWSSPTLLSTAITLTQTATPTTAKASLSTSKFAVMANVASGALTLEFRWRWTVAPPVGPVVTGAWSIPSRSASPQWLPSIFYPAPVVEVVSASPSRAVDGTTFTLALNGSVANTSFRMVLEFPSNGTEIQGIWENTSAKATGFNATLPLSFPGGRLLHAGHYLIHVHDVCGAIVQMYSVTVVRAGSGVPEAVPLRASP